MLLGARETVLRSAYAVLEPRREAGTARRPGVLYLTTERLVFEAPGSRGLVRDLVGGREVEMLIDEPLAKLRNVSLRRGRWSRARLVVDGSEGRVVLDVLEPEAWTVAISDARRRAELATQGPHGASSVPERTVVKIRCRYCRGLAEEGSERCPSCGAPF